MTTLLTIADELYALSLPEFTPARDARAKELKKSDDADLSGPVKALRKPSTAAWVINLFVRREGDQVDQVLEMGSALREAQAGMSGEELRALTRQRRQLTAAVTQQARSLASEAGVRVTQAVAEQVEATFTAAMVDARCGEAVRSGLLVTTLATTGVDEVDVEGAVALPDALGHAATAQSAPEPTRPDLHVVPDPDADLKARAAAQETLDEATERVEQAQEAVDAAAAEVEQLQAKALQTQSEIEELRRRLAELESAHDEVDDDLGDAEDAQSEAQQALDEASGERDEAARALEAL